MKAKIKKQQKQRRQKRTRAKVIGTKNRPRLNIFRSLKYTNVQLIDDIAGKTLISASDNEIKSKKATKVDKAKELGKLIAKKALEQNIKSVVFDRAGYKYHGRVRAVAEGAREAGLEF